jgi:hypothetical protein
MEYGSAQVGLVGHVLPLAREGAEMVYQFEQPFVVDGSRAAGAFGITATPYDEGVRRTLAGLREGDQGGRRRSRRGRPHRPGGPPS